MSQTASSSLGPLRINLLGSFGVYRGPDSVPVSGGTAKVLAFLALQARPVSRSRLAGILWPESSTEKARGSLRSALWRVRRSDDRLVDSEAESVCLASSVRVDTLELVREVRALVDGDRIDLGAIDLDSFGTELLPDWYDEWVLVERERLRQLALHGLEALSRRLTAEREYIWAAQAALAAVALEPLRESAHRALIEVHLAEGNLSDAVRCHRHYTDLLDREMGIAPSPAFTDRIAGQLDARAASAAAR